MAKEIKHLERKCYAKPIPFAGFGSSITHVFAIDENGSAGNLRYAETQVAQKKPVDQARRFFTITECLFSKNEYFNACYLLKKVKQQYWKGQANKILLHSREIRKREGVFCLPVQKYDSFLESLSNVLEMVSCKVVSVTFDLQRYVEHYYTHDPYSVGVDILIKQVIDLTKYKDKVAFVLEARGGKEDTMLLHHIVGVMEKFGSKAYSKEMMTNVIRGVFFNPKTIGTDSKNVYPAIEIADLFSYPIYRYARDGKEGRDFDIVKQKIRGYPDYLYDGLRIFPKPLSKK